MKKKLKAWTLLLTASLFVSSVYGASPMTVQAQEDESNITSYGDTGNVDTPVAEITDMAQAYGKDITFDSTTDWSDQGEHNIALTTAEALNEGAYVTMDVLIPENASFEGTIKVQGAARIGSNWTWTEASNIPELTLDSFSEAVDGYRSASIRFDFGDGVEKDVLAQYTIKLAGYYCDYSGSIYVENIKLYDVQSSGGSAALPEKNPAVIDDFEDGSCDDWVNGGTWQYDNGIANSVVDYNGSRMMKVDLDYTGMGSYTWSEAKLENKFSTAYDISAYNLLTFDYYYPAAFSGSKVKLFSNSGINSEAEITEVETLADGNVKATVQVKFSPSGNGLADLTIGFVGDSTEFVGSVYVDNITLSQYNANGDFVAITSVPGTGAVADISKVPSSVTLADAKADNSATALYAYLISLRESDQVLFGHENDINKMVSSTATEGDVKEVTRSLSGIYGIDTLSLTGAELGLTDQEVALNTAIANSIKAAEGGSIISLSSHMPNFTNEKITVNADGSYNFTACDFSESKDVSNNCAELILPGGAYNDRFTAYLDIIAEYAKALQEKDIPILFRPYHENTGSWFWWGSATSEETYKSLWRYTQEYLQSQGVHNMIYVYSPNGPVTSEADYLKRYPGDEYVDVLAFDYYDDYNNYPATYDDSFFTSLRTTCQVVSGLAEKRGKIAAISETGVRVMKKDGSDNEGLLVTGNPVAGQNWYQQVNNIAAECDMPYWLIWANFGDTNFYVPYKYSDTLGHEMINEFIDFYNSDNAIFGNGTNFYGKIGAVTGKGYTNAQGYLIAPFELATIKEATTFRASVKNATNVSFVVSNSDNGKEITLTASKVSGSTVNEYAAEFTADMLKEIGLTDTATVSLVADGTVLATVKNISLGKDKDMAAANVIENFDFYAGSDGLLQSAYVENSAGGCSSDFTLSKDNKSDGSFGGAFHYSLNTAKSEVWTGQIKTLENNDFSAYNAITMWVKPDGMAQKVVIQLADSSGEEFEVYLTDFVQGTEASYVTIPFSSFVGKQNGTLNTAEITKFAIWCNSIIPKGHTGNWTVDSVLYFDGMQAFVADEELLAQVDENGLIFTENSPIASGSEIGPNPEMEPESEYTNISSESGYNYFDTVPMDGTAAVLVTVKHISRGNDKSRALAREVENAVYEEESEEMIADANEEEVLAQIEENDVVSAEESPAVEEDDSSAGRIPVIPIVTITVLMGAALTGLLLPKSIKLLIGEKFRQIFKARK